MNWVLTFDNDKLVLKSKNGRKKIILLENLSEEQKKLIGDTIARTLIMFVVMILVTVLRLASESDEKGGEYEQR